MDYWYNATVTKVYDGDSITADVDLGFGIIKKNVKIRLANIDTPEIRGEEREHGLIVKEWLSNKILNKQIQINTIKDTKGKYGRYIAYIYLDNVNLNEVLINEGMAEPYNMKY